MTTLDPDDTIAAIASPPGGGMRGLVRITGPVAFAIAGGADAGRIEAAVRPGRRAALLEARGLRRPVPATLVYWPAPRTYTGQPLVEVEAVGATAVLRGLLGTFLERGARLAEPGEFTLRAFLAGRIDLTQAEAVLGVIDAVGEDQLGVALRQLAGGLATPLARLRDDLADTLAHLEANLDFADEADVDPLGRAALAADLARRASEVADLAGRLGGRVRESGRPRVVLVGPPNAGKSRLFNALVGADRSIVAPVAGTTRDYVEAACDCDGLGIDLVDTAGVERADHPIGRLAQEAQAEQVRGADLLLDCRPAGSNWAATGGPIDHPPRLRVATKADLDSSADPMTELATSAATGAGVDRLRVEVARRLRRDESSRSAAGVATTAARSGASLLGAARSLRAASAAVAAGRGDEFVAVDLRQALDDLGRVVGVVVTDDLLDRIFRRFCIGK